MKYFWKPGVLLLCALSGAVVISGCSRNVAVAPEVVVAPQAPVSESVTSSTPDSTSEKSSTKKPEAKGAQIKWEADLDAALARAKKTQKPIMIDFYATWCAPCKLLDEEIYPAADVVKEAQNFVSVKIDVDKEPALREKYKAIGLPMIVFLDPSGNEIHRQLGIDGQVSSFVKLMQTAQARVAPTSA